jgi:hypothetical protein
MVIDDLHVKRIAVAPRKADTPLVVDSDAVLTGSISLKFLQSI